ncbi:LysR family transcriptional regulator [Roseomonas sp. BN140053]|uniref:LysR family transcriptional regulator n=1 Tax=Roseomonas sp. BN140053 TaxID=3391898 RepID=UPI0039EB415F
MLALPPGIDPDLLRSFVLVAEGGSVTRAAQHVGRTQSAVSMQMRRLEDMLGQPLLTRGARGLVPTSHGTWLLDRARRLLEMHDEIIAGFRTPELAGHVRLGSPDDYALVWLPEILAPFAQSHPAVEIEVVCLPSTDLLRCFHAGELDLTLFSAGMDGAGLGAERLWRGPLRWVSAAALPVHLRRPLPVALCRTGCAWSRAAVQALDGSALPWRVAYSSASQTGAHAIALAGLAVTLGLAGSLPSGLRVVGPEDGLPSLPDFEIALHVRHDVPLAVQLGRHISAGFRAELETIGAAA